MSKPTVVIKGKDIEGVGQFSYGMLPVFMKDGTQHRMSPEELVKILQKHEFKGEMKRNFKHLTLK